MEAHNEDGGNEDSDEDEDSDIPAKGGLEFMVDVVSTDVCCALFVSADVIVHDKFKFEEMVVETDVCDKSVASEI